MAVLWLLLDDAQRPAHPPKGVFFVCYEKTLAQKDWMRYPQFGFPKQSLSSFLAFLTEA